MNKKLLLVLLLVAVLALSLAVVGCKSTDTPQEQTPQEDGENTGHMYVVLDEPMGTEVSEYYFADYKDIPEADKRLVVIDTVNMDEDFYDDRVAVKLKKEYTETAADELSAFELEVFNCGIEISKITRDTVVDGHLFFMIYLSNPDKANVVEAISLLQERDDVYSADCVPNIGAKADTWTYPTYSSDQ